MRKKLLFVFCFFALLYSAIIYRLYVFQVKDSREILAQFTGFGEKRGSHPSIRGSIYDRNGVPLALSIVKYNLVVNSKLLIKQEKKDALAAKLASLLGEKKDAVARRINNHNVYNLVAKGIDIADKERIKKSFSPKEKFVYFEETGERIYPEADMALHIIGKCNTENTGLFGLEKVFNDYLSGHATDKKMMCDGAGEFLFRDSGRLRDICDLYVTLDKNIQFYCEDLSRKNLERYKAQSVIILVEEVKTGEILAWSQALKDKKQSAVNIGLTNAFEPGSTHKIFVSAMILAEQKAGFETQVFCENGKWKVYDIEIKDHEKYGALTFKKVFAKSSNIGMAKLGMKISEQNFYTSTLGFGFGSKTGVVLPAEAKGYIPRPDSKSWSGVTQYTMSYGQGMTCNSLQMANAVSCIGNNGMLLRPEVVKKLIDCNGTEIQTAQKTEIRQAVSPETAKAVIEMMRYTVEWDEGTARNARIPGIKAAGKTGTAQKTTFGKKGYTKGRYVSNFAGFFPYDDPEIAIYVVVDEPLDRYYASEVAAPIFSELGSKIAEYLDMKSQAGTLQAAE